MGEELERILEKIRVGIEIPEEDWRLERKISPAYAALLRWPETISNRDVVEFILGPSLAFEKKKIEDAAMMFRRGKMDEGLRDIFELGGNVMVDAEYLKYASMLPPEKAAKAAAIFETEMDAKVRADLEELSKMVKLE